VGLGARDGFASVRQDSSGEWLGEDRPEGRMIALVGDAERTKAIFRSD